MSVTSCYSPDISQTALALLALVAAGKPLDAVTIQFLQSLIDNQNDKSHCVRLTVFSESDAGETERPVILPFVEKERENRVYYNAYGALQMRDKKHSAKVDEKPLSRPAKYRNEKTPQLRIFSPDVISDTEIDVKADELPCLAEGGCFLKIYAE
jgi:hypothetical protein